MMRFCYLDTDIGRLLLAGDADGLKLISFPKGKMAQQPKPNWQEDRQAFDQAKQQLSEYFAGQRKEFDLKIAPQGTAFQLEVLQALQTIPYGQTRSYAELARSIDRPKAVRAVGAANGRNPLPIVIPCHRVIGSNGSLTGFGGGLAAKKALLELENALANMP